jgi:glutathione S-transferase
MARSASAEMHSGFAALRTHISMNIRKDYAGKGMGAGVPQDIARIFAIWQDLRGRFGAGGPFLCGRFSNVDAMFAPVVMRFRTFAVEYPASLASYKQAMLALPALQEWMAAAVAETESIPKEDHFG